jgi:hypothetical protein
MAVKPDMSLVRAWAKKYGIRGDVAPSDRKDKKLKVRRGDKWIHFGHPDYEDYTTHRDPARQERYCRRASAIRNGDGKLAGNDPDSPNYYAMRLLWDCAP